MTDTDTKTLAGTEGVTRSTQLPPHFPPWAGKLAELYFSGTTSMFVVHGNTFDVVRAGPIAGSGCRTSSPSSCSAAGTS